MTPWLRSGVFIVNIFHTFSIVDFEQVNISWVYEDDNSKSVQLHMLSHYLEVTK